MVFRFIGARLPSLSDLSTLSMPLSESQKSDVLEVLDALYSYTVGRRVLSTIFRELPDKNEWGGYYAVIPQPRCLDGVKVRIGSSFILEHPDSGTLFRLQ